MAGLAKAVDTERDDRVAGDRAQPRQGRRMEVPDGDERGTRAQPRQHPLGAAGFTARRPRAAGNRPDTGVSRCVMPFC